MLQQIGDGLKGHKWLTYTVFGALALIFAAWGAYGVANLNIGSGNFAAKVNGHSIPYDDVRAAWQREQTQWQQRVGGEMPAGQKAAIQDELLEQIVRADLISDRATDLGYRVSEERLKAAVRAEPAFQLDGQYNADVAKSRLAQAGLTTDQYEADLRNSLQRSELQEAIQQSQFITPAEVERLHALNNQERQIRYALLPVAKFAADVQITDAAIQAYYDAHKAQFMTPESVNLAYAQISLVQVTAQTQISDADVQAYYTKNQNRYISTEQRHAHQILIAVNAKVDAAAALKKADAIEARLKAGENFEAVAKQSSDDAGSAAQGGDMGLNERSSFEAPFGDALFAMKPGEVSPPVRTKFGYQIIRLDEVVPAKGKTLEEARTDVQDQLRHDRAADRFGDLQEQIQQKIDQSGETLDTLAKEFGLTMGNIPQYFRGTGGGDLGSTRELQDLVFGDAVLGEHRIGGPLVVGEDRLVLVKDLSHALPTPKPLAVVHDLILATLRNEAGTQAAMKAAAAAVKDLQAGKDFDAVVKQLGVPAEAARFVGRQDPSVPAAIREAAFKAPKPTGNQAAYQALPQPDGGALLLGVLAVRAADVPADKQQDASAVRDLAQQYGEDDARAYIEAARKSAKVQKNIAIFDQ